MKRYFALLLMAAAMFPVREAGGVGIGAEPAELSLTTYANTSVGGALTAPEPEQAELYYAVTAEPVKGYLCVLEDGTFVYTPRDGKLGRDNFFYQVSDGEGNIFREACVCIQIQSQSGGVYYEDMHGRPEAYAAARLSEEGLFTGEQVVGRYCFNPEKPVTRGEFLSICLRLSGKPILSAAQATGRLDDEAIPAWMKSYVLTASLHGVETNRGANFEGDAPITQEEAASMARQILGIRWTGEPTSDAVLDRAGMARILSAWVG